ncbi:MAG TPA: LL-diaminopimelate aminotransferase [Actinomycetota bacterium]|nr:LL-diaminopimelate aminotransferase [Actinomycetota bacterium]
MRTAKRIDQLPPYLFATLDRRIAEARDRGVDVISFAIGDPDLPTPGHIVAAAQAAVADPANHRYPSYYGLADLRRAIAGYYQRRFGIDLDPESQVLPLIGSKEGIHNLATAFVDPGDTVLIPDPGYPVYATSAILAGGRPVPFPLEAAHGFQPRLGEISPGDAVAAKILWLNYPGNPTSATVAPGTFEQAVEFCRSHNLLLAHDAAYVDVTYDGYVAPSVLQTPGATEVALEFGSLSKTYNMTGWRIGWAVGSPVAVEALGRVKTNIDSGIFNALQRAGIEALNGPQEAVAAQCAVYTRRRDTLVDALNAAGWALVPPKAALYLWAPTPGGEPSQAFADFLLDRAGVVVTPGVGYGAAGEGFVRFSLTIDDDRLAEGAERIARALRAAGGRSVGSGAAGGAAGGR